MRRKTILMSLFIGAGLLISFDAVTFTSGAPTGSTASPSSNNASCAKSGCHVGGPSVSSQTVAVTSDIPSTGFLPNTVYNFTVTADAGSTVSNKIGFEVSIEDGSGHVGTLTSGMNNQKFGQYITHNSNSTSASNNMNSWDFSWNSGNTPGNATVYVAVNFSNSNGQNSGDVILTSQEVLQKGSGIGVEELSVAQFSIWPNPASSYVEIENTIEAERIEIFSLNGALIKSFDETSRVDASSWRLDIREIPGGNYLIATSGSKQAPQRLLIKR